MNTDHDPFGDDETLGADERRALRDASHMSLCRGAGSPAAASLLAEVTEGVRQAYTASGRTSEGNATRRRPIGAKGLSRLRREVGTILGGLLGRGEVGDYFTVQRGHSAAMWRQAPPVGSHAFFSRLDALIALGLVEEIPAIRYVGPFNNFGGDASRLRASASLRAMAEAHGCTVHSRSEDWPVLYLPPPPPDIAAVDLVTFTDWPTVRMNGLIAKAGRKRLPLPDLASSILKDVERLNAQCDALAVTGCARPRFRRIYGPTLDQGGRFYATGGADCFQRMRSEDRRRITINGESVAEVDLRAAALSIYLAKTGAPLPEGDPYALDGFDRESVKAFCVQSLYPGRLRMRWASGKAIPGVSAKALRAMLLERYPALSELSVFYRLEKSAITPPDPALAGWASGQFIQALEGQIIARATAQVWEAGGIAWPFHDALLVPLSSVEQARGILADAFRDRLGQTPQITVAYGLQPSLSLQGLP